MVSEIVGTIDLHDLIENDLHNSTMGNLGSEVTHHFDMKGIEISLQF